MRLDFIGGFADTPIEKKDAALVDTVMESEGAGAPLSPSADPSWLLYASTILELQSPAAKVVIDLRRSISGAQRVDLMRLWNGAFAVVTAYNPIGRMLSPIENEARHDRLRDVLERCGIVHRPANGLSPDGAHCERGFALHASLDTARDLSCQFEQSALFWFDGASFCLVGALVAARPRRLPLDVR